MAPNSWTVLIVSPNKFEAKIQAELVRDAGARRIHVLADNTDSMQQADELGANIILLALDNTPEDSLDWVRRLRRARGSRSQKAFVFLTSRSLTMALAQKCRLAGANAVIGLPVSSATLLNTITKVLAKPRPFIEDEVYAGPCRRAGIVTAGAGKFRRKSDPRTQAA